MLPLLLLLGCPPNEEKTTAAVRNSSLVDTTVYVAFGATSAIQTEDWKEFCSGSGLNCYFPLEKGRTRELPIHARNLNATFSFMRGVTCNTTKAEVNVNNPEWYDVADISLVDGFNVPMRMQFGLESIGPVVGATGNESLVGVFPNGCDICVARQSPPCGMTPGTDGCKTGSQYDPDVPCQVQGSVMGGGNNRVMIELLDLVPA
jgi:hypothetical protein